MRKLWAGSAIGFAAAVLALIVGHLPLFVVAEAKLYDWRLSRAARAYGQPNTGIALVEINDASLIELAPLIGRWPWPRVTHASIIDFLAKGGAKVIAYDLQLTEPDSRLSFQYGDQVMSGDISDAELSAAIGRAGNVVLLADAVYEGVTGVESRPSDPLPDAGYPFSELAEPRDRIAAPMPAFAAGARALGHNRLELD